MAWPGWGDKGESKGGTLERIMALGASALGLVGFLYALGGAVIWLRVQTAQLTPSSIVAANDRHLLEVGVSVVAFELFLLLATGVIVAFLVAIRILFRQRQDADSQSDAAADQSESERGSEPEEEPATSGSRRKLEKAWKDEEMLAGIVFPTIGLILFTCGLGLSGPTPLRAAVWLTGLAILVAAALGMIFLQMEKFGGWVQLARLQRLTGALLPLALGVGIFVLPLLQGAILLAGTTLIYLGPFLLWPDAGKGDVYVKEVLRSTGLWVAITLITVVALAWVATPPVSFTYARLNSVDREHPQNGAYLDRGDGGVYIGTCTVKGTTGDGYQTSTESRVIFVPGKESARVRLGQETYHFDPGGRPSLWQTFKTMLGGGIPGVHDAPLHHPLRLQVDDVCDGS